MLQNEPGLGSVAGGGLSDAAVSAGREPEGGGDRGPGVLKIAIFAD